VHASTRSRTVLLVLLTISLAGCAASAGSASPAATPTVTTAPASSAPSVDPSPTAVASPSEAAEVLDTDTWAKYTSDRYGFTLRHPADWVELPADHDWTIDEATGYWSTGHERFHTPAEDVGVSVWGYDPGPDVRLETTEQLVAWAEDYCRLAANVPCEGIAERAVPLCFGTRDCHPAVLVPFTDDVYAIVPGFSDDGMIIAAVWRPESDGSVQPFGGARNLLEAYLSTINADGTTGVFPSAAP
jgi:hypothetical protein